MRFLKWLFCKRPPPNELKYEIKPIFVSGGMLNPKKDKVVMCMKSFRNSKVVKQQCESALSLINNEEE